MEFDRGHVIRSPTPPRGPIELDARETLWMLARSPGQPIVRADLVALADAVELETFEGGQLRRCLRFLRDTGARRYAERLGERLRARGFTDYPDATNAGDKP